jgi:chemotaxis signal transduction protein
VSGVLGNDRLLAFELSGTLFALPITDVAEVSDVPEIAAVPMLEREIGGVVNHHGDALPVVFGSALFEGSAPSKHEHLLVLARDLDDPSRYALPVDRIHGLVDGPAAQSVEPGCVIAARRPLGDRLINVLDPRELFDRAVAVIEQSMTGEGQSRREES